MYPSLTDSLAREHADRMMSAAAAHRRAREAQRGHSAGAPAPRTAGRPTRLTAWAHAAARPATAARGWLAAGQL